MIPVTTSTKRAIQNRGVVLMVLRLLAEETVAMLEVGLHAPTARILHARTKGEMAVVGLHAPTVRLRPAKDHKETGIQTEAMIRIVRMVRYHRVIPPRYRKRYQLFYVSNFFRQKTVNEQWS